MANFSKYTPPAFMAKTSIFMPEPYDFVVEALQNDSGNVKKIEVITFNEGEIQYYFHCCNKELLGDKSAKCECPLCLTTPSAPVMLKDENPRVKELIKTPEHKESTQLEKVTSKSTNSSVKKKKKKRGFCIYCKKEFYSVSNKNRHIRITHLNNKPSKKRKS